ncbi:MAG: L-seryl-tRNA(Sec) selenium transferase [Cyanobacteria bacterium REEB67]|nr:L-seryl-tRNA(Sec) selenium transferase [Cyanobacteria bacterium REEB67]
MGEITRPGGREIAQNDNQGGKKELQKLPQVDKILREPELESLALCVRRDIIARAVRIELQKLRADRQSKVEITPATVAAASKTQIMALLDGGLRRVLNGTGVILSTNLGRAPLPAFAVEKLSKAIASYSNLEFDLEDGERGERTEQLSAMLGLLTGSQSAIVVNNCAAAVMLAVQALAAGKEVIVSRGELIEIGGSFRLPDVIAAAGGILKEVGTTNRTRLSDYAKAISAKTGMILKCHRSNFQIVGFTEECDVAELSTLAREKNIALAYDLGGGCFVDLSQYDLLPEPTVEATLAAGASLVMYSGDKLLGGPQAGIISGSSEYVARLRKCPIYRTLRADKVVLALLEAVVSQYLIVDGAARLPVFQLAAIKQTEIADRVHSFIDREKANLPALQLTAKETVSTMGGGSLPGEKLPSYALVLTVEGGRLSEAKLAKRLRHCDPPVISTTTAGAVVLDFRTIKEDEEGELAAALRSIQEDIMRLPTR